MCAGRNLVDVDQFVAGGDDRDTRAAAYVDHRAVERRERPQVRRAEPLARFHHQFARAQVLAARSDERSWLGGGQDFDRVAVGTRPLDRHDSVSAKSDRRARHRAHRRPRLDPRRRHRSRRDGPQHPKAHRARLAGMGNIGGAHGIAVHRRVVEAGDVAWRADFFGQHAAERGHHRRALDAEGRHGFEHQL